MTNSLQEDQITEYSRLRTRYEREQLTIEFNEVYGSKAKEDANIHFNSPQIFPGVYSPSGFDMMSILTCVAFRPNPKIDIGAVDCSCALLLCNSNELDNPIVYCSDAFEKLSGYRSDEILGTNCRFLQHPGGVPSTAQGVPRIDGAKISMLKKKIEEQEEVQTELINYTKDGRAFINLLTVIPIKWGTDGRKYFVGFQIEKQAHST